MFLRICDLTLIAHRNERPSRAQLAERWNMTTRAVSYIIEHADRVYGIRFQYETNDAGYALVDPGIINLSVLERWKP